eukprot:1196435-Prorocentrum_minimum.AAC.3
MVQSDSCAAGQWCSRTLDIRIKYAGDNGRQERGSMIKGHCRQEDFLSPLFWCESNARVTGDYPFYYKNYEASNS